jgi:outer membrane immunogenic protein
MKDEVTTGADRASGVMGECHMKKFLLGAAMLIALAAAVPARAAEVYGGVIPPDFFTAPPAFAPPRAYNWTGVYVGINAGGAWGRSSWVESPWVATPIGGNSTLSGGLLGGTLGYNLQAGTSSVVLGVEVDLDWANIKATTPPFVAQVISVNNAAVPPFISTPTPGCTPNCEIASPWLATARLRFGYSFDWILPFVTAGVAAGRLEANIAGIPLGRQSANNLGWTVGAGVEMVISGPWTAKLEFLHVDLHGFSCDKSCGMLDSFDVNGNLIQGGVNINAIENIIRVGLNYRIWNR